jgi:hypothetical protein
MLTPVKEQRELSARKKQNKNKKSQEDKLSENRMIIRSALELSVSIIEMSSKSNWNRSDLMEKGVGTRSSREMVENGLIHGGMGTSKQCAGIQLQSLGRLLLRTI